MKLGAVAIYARMSVDDTEETDVNHAAGIDRQVEACRRLGQDHGYEVPDELVFSDNDVSATNRRRRPAYERLLESVRAGRVSIVIVWHTDRLYRRLRDLVPLLEVAETSGLMILSVQAGPLDLTTPSGRMVAGILGSVATHEGEHRAARQLLAYQQAAARGEWKFSVRPFGYAYIPAGVNKRLAFRARIKIHPAEAEIVRELFTRYYERGESRHSLVKWMNTTGHRTPTGKPWSVVKVREMLKNSKYAGIVTYRGAETFMPDGSPATAAWPALIDRAKFGKYMLIAADRRAESTFTRSATSLLSGIPRCGMCDAPMYRARRHKGGHDYRCARGGHVAMLSSKLDKLITDAVVASLMMTPTGGSQTGSDLSNFDGALAELDLQRNELLVLVKDGLATAAKVRPLLADIVSKETDLVERRARIMRENVSLEVLAGARADLFKGPAASFEDAVKVKAQIRANFASLPLERQRAIIKMHVAIAVHGGRTDERVDIEYLAALGLNDAVA